MARNLVKVTIASSGTVSGLANGRGGRAAGVYLPGVFTGTALTFRSGTPDGNTAGLISDGAGSSYTRTVRAGDYVPLPADIFAGCDQIAVISGSSEAAARDILVAFV